MYEVLIERFREVAQEIWRAKQHIATLAVPLTFVVPVAVRSARFIIHAIVRFGDFRMLRYAQHDAVAASTAGSRRSAVDRSGPDRAVC